MNDQPRPAPTKTGGRAVAIDALKGLIMVVMALDHVRSFFLKWDGVKEIWYAPATYNPMAWDFWARYVSHLAAPGFFFLMGMGMVLMRNSRIKAGWEQNRVVRNLVIRGLILVALQFMLEDAAWAMRTGNIARFLSTGVLSTLGLAMVFSAFALRFRGLTMLALGTALLIGNQVAVLALDMNKDGLGLAQFLLVYAGAWGPVKVNYPLIPWLGVTLLGMAYGVHWARDAERCYRQTLWGGLALIAAFVVMRYLPGGIWNLRPAVDGTFFGFMQVTKYPPSLSWLALTLGANALILWLFWKGEVFVSGIGQVLLDYGRSPLFFYVVHLHLYGAMSLFVFNRHPTIASEAAVVPAERPQDGEADEPPHGRFKASTHPESVWRFF